MVAERGSVEAFVVFLFGILFSAGKSDVFLINILFSSNPNSGQKSDDVETGGISVVGDLKLQFH
jgi:hypothetical protein